MTLRDRWMREVECAVVHIANHPDHTVVLQWLRECKEYHNDPGTHFQINAPTNPFPQLDVKLRVGLEERVKSSSDVSLKFAVGLLTTQAHERGDMASGRAILCLVLQQLQITDDQNMT